LLANSIVVLPNAHPISKARPKILCSFAILIAFYAQVLGKFLTVKNS